MLEEILAVCREQLNKDKKETDRQTLAALINERKTIRSLARSLSGPGLGLIAEIKGASPSKGSIRSNIDPVKIAEIYRREGAAAISVLTEPHYFNGSLDYLAAVRKAVDLPLLRKDFIFDEFQLYQARAYGADAVLLIAEVVTDDDELARLIDVSHRLELEVLMESTGEDNLKRSIASQADVIGINNRDFHSLRVDLNTSLNLIKSISTDRPVVSESGIFTRKDVERLASAGFNGILVGTSLMESKDIGGKIRELIGKNG